MGHPGTIHHRDTKNTEKTKFCSLVLPAATTDIAFCVDVDISQQHRGACRTAGNAAVQMGKLHHGEWAAGQPRVQCASGWKPHLGGDGERSRALRKWQVEG